MLTLTRKAQQTIQIGVDITIVVKKIRGKQVMLSINAPNHIRIIRDDAIQRQPSLTSAIKGWLKSRHKLKKIRGLLAN